MIYKIIQFFIIVFTLIVTWSAIIYIFKLPNYILPTPFEIILVLREDIFLLLTHAKPTLIETLFGLLFGILLGSSTALLVGYYRGLSLWLLPLILISQSLPTFAIAPFLVIWFGYGITTKIITAAIMIFFPVTSAFYDGLRKQHDERLALAKTMGASKWKTFYHIVIPGALPRLASGIRIAAVTAPLGAVIGEWVGSSEGLGYLMLNANARMQIDLMFAALIILISMSLILYFFTDQLMRRLIWWTN